MDIYKILGWIVTPIITYILGISTTNIKYRKELAKERKLKNIELKIKSLIKLRETISLHMTSINRYIHEYFNYFEEIRIGQRTFSEKNWLKFNDKMKDKNYIPIIDKKLLLLPEIRKKFKTLTKKYDNQEYNFYTFNVALLFIKPNLFYQTISEGRSLKENELIAYKGMWHPYSDLCVEIIRLIEEEIDEQMLIGEKSSLLTKLLDKFRKKDEYKSVENDKEKNHFNLISYLVVIIVFLLNFGSLFIVGWLNLGDKPLINISFSKLIQNEKFITMSLIITISSFITAGIIPSTYSYMTSERNVSNKMKPLTKEQKLLREDTKDFCLLFSYLVFTLILVIFILSSLYTNTFIGISLVVLIFVFTGLLISLIIKSINVIFKILKGN
mgnify:CR=1 FL=1